MGERVKGEGEEPHPPFSPSLQGAPVSSAAPRDPRTSSTPWRSPPAAGPPAAPSSRHRSKGTDPGASAGACGRRPRTSASRRRGRGCRRGCSTACASRSSSSSPSASGRRRWAAGCSPAGTRCIGGSETDATAFAVNPRGRPVAASSVVTTVTPVAKWPITRRSSIGSTSPPQRPVRGDRPPAGRGRGAIGSILIPQLQRGARARRYSSQSRIG